jgi:hypothetical protein
VPPHHRARLFPAEDARGTVEQVEEVPDQFLLYGQTVSSIVVYAPVPRRPLPAAGPADRPG